jgi:uncharacterized protein (DUF2249 family)
MSKREPAEYRAKVTDDAGIFRGKVPSPLIRELGGRPGDYMVFQYDGAGRVLMSIARTRGGTKASVAKSKKRGGRTNGKRR